MTRTQNGLLGIRRAFDVDGKEKPKKKKKIRRRGAHSGYRDEDTI